MPPLQGSAAGSPKRRRLGCGKEDSRPSAKRGIQFYRRVKIGRRRRIRNKQSQRESGPEPYIKRIAKFRWLAIGGTQLPPLFGRSRTLAVDFGPSPLDN